MLDYDIKERLFCNALVAFWKLRTDPACNNEDSREYVRAHAKFIALYFAIEEVPGLEDDFIEFKSRVFRILGTFPAALKTVTLNDLFQAIDQVVTECRNKEVK